MRIGGPLGRCGGYPIPDTVRATDMQDLDELLELLRDAALNGSPDNPSYRAAAAMRCGACLVRTRLIDWWGTQAVFGCPSCGRCEAVEIPVQ